MAQSAIQTALRLVYPPRCTVCGLQVESEFALCGPCWRDTPFISGLCCDACGMPLPGQSPEPAELCDECITTSRPWQRGRAAMLYRDNGRALVLALKHGDRHEIARPAARWMAQAAKPLLTSGDILVVPIPLHWTRLLSRRYNQSAILSQHLARQTGLPCCPDLLVRGVRTPSLNGLGVLARFEAMSGAITVRPSRAGLVRNRTILLIDDVMTSGATLSACAEACITAGAEDVHVLVLARAGKDA